MKRVKFTQEFYDKYTGELYAKGGECEFEDRRADELVSDPRGLAELVIVDYDGAKLSDLRTLADSKGIDTKGMKKADIIKALAEVGK